MPPADVEVVKRLYEALESRDDEALQRVLDDNIEWTVSTTLPWGGRRRGFGEVVEGIHTLGEVVRSAKFDQDEFVDVGNGEVIATGRLSGEGALTGAPFEAEYANRIVVSDGRITRFQSYIDTGEILKALGDPPAD
jgi:ketosteroid isomerase-like protein